jgi:putative phage-type endonuclease
MDKTQIRIGASEVAAALGVSPYQTPLAWWAQKLGRTEAFTGNDATTLGQYLEDGIARLFEDTHKVRLTQGEDVRHPELSWMAATPDRLVEWDGMSAGFKETHRCEPGEVVLLEVKTTGLANWRPLDITRRDWGDEGSRDVPIQYAAQVQQQIAIVDAALRSMDIGYCRRAIVKALVPGRGCPEFVIDADPEVQSWLRTGLEVMVEQHLVPEIAPEPVNGTDWKLVEDMLPRRFKGKDARRTATDDETALMAAYRDTKAMLDETKTRVAQLRAQIVTAIGDDYALDSPLGRISYSLGKEMPKLRKAAALDELCRWVKGAPWEVQLAFEEALKKHTASKWTGRRFTARFVDLNDDDNDAGDDE